MNCKQQYKSNTRRGDYHVNTEFKDGSIVCIWCGKVKREPTRHVEEKIAFYPNAAMNTIKERDDETT